MPPTGYHHGDLPNALRAAAADVLAERGVAGFSLREVARRAGVSHAAPAHHFGDVEGLLTAVAVEAFRFLATEVEAAAAGVDDPVEALARIGRAYVTVAIDHPGHCAVVFRTDAVDADDAAYAEWGARAYGALLGVVERLAQERNPDLDVPLAASTCWAAMQGLVELHAPITKMAVRHGGRPEAIDVLAERVSRLLAAGLVAPDR